MPTYSTYSRRVFDCRRRHAKLIRVWRAIPSAAWLLTINSGVLTVLGWSMAASLDINSRQFSHDAKSSAVILALGLLCSVGAIIAYVRRGK